jgi:threonine synthase
MVSPDVRREITDVFLAGSADDAETAGCIRHVYERMGYLLDPHTAVAWKVWKDLGTSNKTVIVSTASPYKFAGDVLNALEEESVPRSGGREDCEKLYERTGVEPPAAIQELWSLPVLHNRVCGKEDMASALFAALGK